MRLLGKQQNEHEMERVHIVKLNKGI